MTEPVVTDILVVLTPKVDLAGRGARKRQGRLYTKTGQLVVNVWSDPTELDGLHVGEIEVTEAAAAPYLWYRREPLLEHLERAKRRVSA